MAGSIGPILPYSWYVFCAILFYFVFYLAFRLAARPLIGILLCGAFTVALMAAFRLMGWGAYWWISLPMFPVGLLFKYVERRWFDGMPAGRVAAAMLLVCLAASALRVAGVGGVQWATGFLLSLVWLLPLTLLNVSSKALAFLGGISYEVYLVQGIAFLWLRNDTLYVADDRLFACASVVLTVVLAYVVKLSLGRLDATLFGRAGQRA